MSYDYVSVTPINAAFAPGGSYYSDPLAYLTNTAINSAFAPGGEWFGGKDNVESVFDTGTQYTQHQYLVNTALPKPANHAALMLGGVALLALAAYTLEKRK